MHLSREVVKRLKLIIVDLDGTLVDTNIPWNDIRDKVRTILKLDKSEPLKPLATALYRYHKLNPNFNEAIELIERYELKSINNMYYPANLPNVIKDLKASTGIKLGLVTLRSYRTLKPLLEKTKLSNLFDIVVTRDIAYDRYDQLIKVLNYTSIPSGSTLFIGDWIGDLNAGLKAGLHTIIVNDPDEVIEIFKEIISIRTF